MLRLGGVLLLAAGLLAAARWSPAAVPPWTAVELLTATEADCAARLDEREGAPFTVPDRPAEPVTAAAVARWFHLQPGAVCAANGIAPAGCAAHAFTPGERLTLPLGRLPATPPPAS